MPTPERQAPALAERIASLVGWPLIAGQSAVIAGWITWNVLPGLPHFDPYPFILLNLGLSLQAAYTGPVLLIAARRQEERDRELAEKTDRDILDVRAIAKHIADHEGIEP